MQRINVLYNNTNDFQVTSLRRVKVFWAAFEAFLLWRCLQLTFVDEHDLYIIQSHFELVVEHFLELMIGEFLQ